MTDGLNCIRMKKDSLFTGQGSYFGNRHNSPNLIACGYDSNEDCVLPYGVFKLIKRNVARGIHTQICHLISCLFKAFKCVQNCMMLQYGRYNMLSFIFFHYSGGSYSPIISFCSTTGNKYLIRSAAERGSYFCPGVFHRFFCTSSKGIYGRRVTVFFSQIRHHFLQGMPGQ